MWLGESMQEQNLLKRRIVCRGLGHVCFLIAKKEREG